MAAAKLSDRVPIPPKDTINTNLSPVTEQLMLTKFGKPGALTKDCSAPRGKVKKRLKSGVDMGPFRVSGMDFAVITDDRVSTLYAFVERPDEQPADDAPVRAG